MKVRDFNVNNKVSESQSLNTIRILQLILSRVHIYPMANTINTYLNEKYTAPLWFITAINSWHVKVFDFPNHLFYKQPYNLFTSLTFHSEFILECSLLFLSFFRGFDFWFSCEIPAKNTPTHELREAYEAPKHK